MRKANKVLALILALILAISMLPMSAMATETTENTDPSAISTPEQFMAMVGGKNYYLTKDIDFSTTTITTPYLVKEFYGTLNGNGHTISGINLSYTATEAEATEDVRVAIIGQIGGRYYPTSISNLNIDDITITVNDSVTTTPAGKPLNISFVAGRIYDGRKVVIDNVHITNGEINATFGARYHNVIGGIVADAGYRSLTVNDSSVSGTITATADDTGVDTYVGGMLGCTRTFAGIKAGVNNCVNNANITLTYPEGVEPTAISSVGGMIGKTSMTLSVVDCENNGTLTTTANKGGILGYVDDVDTVGDILVVLADSNTKEGNIYGGAISGARICVAGCTVGEGEAATASTQNSTMTAITKASDFSQLNGSKGFFYLANDIDFEGFTGFEGEEPKENFAYYVNSFSGVLYGNGKTVKNIELNSTGNMGFFNYVAAEDHSAIVNLSLGTPEAPVKVSGGSGSAKIGTLMGYAGYDTTGTGVNFNTVVSDVDIYVDFTAIGGNVGGVAGLVRDFSCYDSNFYGKMSPASSSGTYYAGFVGYCTSVTLGSYCFNEITLMGCNNYANITNSSGTQYMSGLLGATNAYNTFVIDCKNFGDVLCAGYASAFVANARNSGCFIVSNCVNFGTLDGATCGVAIATSNHTSGTTRVTGVVDYGTVTVTGTNRYIGAMGETDLVVNDCIVYNVLAMQNGAAVRIDPVVTGLRYKATINADALAKLVELFGEDAVSYGTIIAPAAFVTAAGGELMAETLDTWSEKRDDLFAEGEKAYVDVPATEWFVGANGTEENVIAGSIVNLSGLYEDAFIGRAYVKINVNENKTVCIYADYFDGKVENNTRTVKGVTEAAVNDLLYKNGEGYFTYNETDGYVAVTDEAVIAKYSTSVGTEGEYTKYSRYDSEDYGDLTELLALINQ